MSCASESELLPSLLSHMQVSAIEPEPPRSFLSCSGQGFNVRADLARADLTGARWPEGELVPEGWRLDTGSG